MSYIKKSLPKVASLGLASMMLVSAMPTNQASASELPTNTAVTQEVAKQTLEGYLASKGQATKVATAEQLKLPFAPELYHVREQFTPAGQTAWDYALKQLLAFDPANNYGDKLKTLDNGNGAFTVDLEESGIEVTKQDIPRFREHLTAGEPRMFLIGNYGGEPTVGQDGKVKSITFTIKATYMKEGAYQKTLQDIENVVSEILAPLDERMTDAQKLNAFYDNYKASTSYVNEGSSQDIDGAFINKKVICGGYSKAFQYLAMRSGVKTMFIGGQASGPHAWNYSQIDGQWYLVDSTWDDQLSTERYFLQGASTSTGHIPNDFYTQMATLSQTPYERNKIIWLLPEKYEETSQQAVDSIVEVVRTSLNKWSMAIADLGTIKTSLPVGTLYNNSSNPFVEFLMSDLKSKLNKLDIDGEVSITIDNSARHGNAQAIINSGLIITHQVLPTTPKYQFVAGKFSQVQPEVVEKDGTTIARETYDSTVSIVETILTKYQAKLSQVNDIMVISPKEFDYVGKNTVEQQIADELAKELEGKFKGRLAVIISGNASYTTPEDFINGGVLIGFQSEYDGKYHQFTQGGQVSVYEE